MSFWADKRVVVTGGAGFVGSHVADLLRAEGVSGDRLIVPRRAQHDLRKLDACLRVLDGADIVLHLAADVGGLGYSRDHPATQYYNCSLLDLQIMEAARQTGVSQTVLVSSAVSYPVEAVSPLREEGLFDGRPAVSSFGYGFAKRMTCVLAEAYHQEFGMPVCVLLANNSYGPRDDFEEASSHVIPATIRKCLNDRELVVWGDGSPARDFLFVEDFARGVLLAAEHGHTPEPINLGSGEETAIRDLVYTIVSATGFQGPVHFDAGKPSGQARRSVDISRARRILRFSPQVSLEEGIQRTVEWYKAQGAHGR